MMFRPALRNSLIVLALIAGVSTLIAAQTKIRLRQSVLAPAAPVITTTSLANATQGTSYNVCISATGGTPPYTWDKTVGVYPAGLSLVAGTGCFSGTPTTLETQVFTVRVTDNAAVTDTRELSLTVVASGGGSLTCTTTAASGSHTDVQAAFNAATAANSVVCIPAGTWNWTSTVSWTAPTNGVVVGAGPISGTGSAGQTIIVDNIANNNTPLGLTTPASGTLRMTNLTLRGGSGLVKENAMMSMSGATGTQFRIDHVTLDQSTYSPQNASKIARFYGLMNGVVDHSAMIADISTAFDIWGEGQANGDASWALATEFGTNKFIYVEDSTFTTTPGGNSGANDCSHGGKYVWRYNTHSSPQAIQTHPTGGSGRGRGCRATEAYGNTFNGVDGGNDFNFFWLSSGPSVIWGNTANGYKHFLTLHSMRANSNTYPESPTPTGWGYCGTEFNGTGSNWDKNDNATTGRPCMDQPGQGGGDLLTGDFPNVTNSGTGCTAGSPCAWPRQAHEGVYEWLNTWSSSAPGNMFIAVADGARMLQNTDYFLYYGNTSCNQGAGSCTAGVGSGTRAQRPSNCTTGVAWWSTDQGGNWHSGGGANDGTIDKCTSTNTWTNGFYTPYTYPHPLATP